MSFELFGMMFDRGLVGLEALPLTRLAAASMDYNIASQK